MPYTRVTRTSDGTASLLYVTDGKGHNGNANRNELVTLIRLHNNEPIHKQMMKYWCRARSNHTTQIIRIVQSFSKKELDPDNPADILKANEIGQAMVDEYFPDRQAVVCTQKDGKGGCIHNHILINDVSMKDNKACKREQYYQPILMKWTDEITERYAILDAGEETEEKLTQTERAKREKGEYLYKDDIRERVMETMKRATSEEDFLHKLFENGVNAVKRYTKKYGDYYTYELIDFSKIPPNAKLPKCPNGELKIRSYKLGTAYGPKALKEHIGLYERVGIRKEFTGNDDTDEIEITPKMSFQTNEKTEQDEETITVPTPVPIIENEHEDLRAVIMDMRKDEEEETDSKTTEKVSITAAKTDIKRGKTRHRANDVTEQEKIDSSRFDRVDVGYVKHTGRGKGRGDFGE